MDQLYHIVFWICLILLFLVFIAIFFAVLMVGIGGAILLFVRASAQGFVGMIVYFAAWVFMFPLMIALSVIFGFIETRDAATMTKKEKPANKREPPVDEYERYKWANRLPPYDK